MATEGNTEAKPKTVWFENVKTGVKFAIREGSRTHVRVTNERNSHRYKPTTKPAKG